MLRSVPDYPELLCDDNYNLFNKDKEPIPWNRMGKYLSVTINSDVVGRVTLGKHRLVLLMTDYRPDHRSLIVNHIDGDTLNNEPDNVEWCTYSENIQHAYETNLRDDNFKTIVHDTTNGEEYTFISLACAARFFKVSPSTLHSAEKRKGLLLKRYRVKIIRHKPSTTDSRKANILTRHIVTGSIMEFIRYSDVAEMLKVDTNLIRRRLNEEWRWPISGYDFQHREVATIWPKYDIDLAKALAKEKFVHSPLIIDGVTYGNVSTASVAIKMHERKIRDKLSKGEFKSVSRKDFAKFNVHLG